MLRRWTSSRIVAGYVDQTSEEIVATYSRERENWLRNRSAARAARIRDLLSGQPVDVAAAEATLGYRLRQYHAGVVCWTDAAVLPGAGAVSADNISRLDGDLHVAFGDVARGAAGFRLTHEQAIAARAVALAGGSPPPVVCYGDVAPVAMMLGSAALLRAWVLAVLGGLATDDEPHARLRETLLVFLDTGGSYKATAERLVLHKNTVQYRMRRAEESLGHPVGDRRHDVELALQACRWLGSTVLPSPAPDGVAAVVRNGK